MLAEDDVAGLLTAQTVAVLGHVLVHVFVTDCGLLVGDAFPGQMPCKGRNWT